MKPLYATSLDLWLELENDDVLRMDDNGTQTLYYDPEGERIANVAEIAVVVGYTMFEGKILILDRDWRSGVSAHPRNFDLFHAVFWSGIDLDDWDKVEPLPMRLSRATVEAAKAIAPYRNPSGWTDGVYYNFLLDDDFRTYLRLKL